MALGGLVLGLAIAELVFYERDDGAFPHVNFYVADPVLGVRLEPGATERISFGGNPVTHVRINRAGYRGADWPPPGPDEVLVVGDSQVFGLGVEEAQTFSARLAKATSHTVIDAGVPTYGPGEYRAVIQELLAKRHPKTVVLTLSLANDLFEADRPDRERHVVWDGWAVRKETAPASVTSFPGRELLFRRSHLVFALRKWLHAGDATDARGVPSEGTWKDILASGEHVASERSNLDAERTQRLQEITQLHAKLGNVEADLDDKILQVLIDDGADSFTVRAARANPGDIVSDNEFAESSRSITVTAGQIAAAAAVRARLRVKLERWAKAHHGATAKDALAQLSTRAHALARLSELDAQRLQAVLDPPLGAYVRDVQRLVESAGARLVVVVLPLDVQVSPAEWKKYGAKPIDMTASLALDRELVALCHELGVSALDAAPVLAAAEPGAFLNHDVHMSPRGHAAVAAALAKLLAAPPPTPPHPSDRSPVPLPEIWRDAPEVIVKGSTAAGCETKQVREWLRVRCGIVGEDMWPVGVEVERDDGGEALVLQMPREITLVIPVVQGREFAAKLRWRHRTRELRVRWPAGAGKPTYAFDAPVAAPAVEPGAGALTAFKSGTEREICDCWRRVFGGARYTQRDEVFTCPGAYGAADPACVRAYNVANGRCADLLACIRRDPASPP